MPQVAYQVGVSWRGGPVARCELGGQSSNAVCGALESAQAGVTHGLARISIGIEHWRDLLDDFEQALALV